MYLSQFFIKKTNFFRQHWRENHTGMKRKHVTKHAAFGDTSGDVVDGLASYGRITSLVQAIVVTIAAACGVGVGIYMLKKSYAELESVATVNAPSACQQEIVSTSTKGRTKTRLEKSCTTDVSYTAGVATHQHVLDTDALAYATGDKLSVYYDPSAPSAPSAKRVPGFVFWIVIAGSILASICAWIWFFVTRASKVAAAASGAYQAIGVLGIGRRY